MFVQITELSPEGERDWLVQAEDPNAAHELLYGLVRHSELRLIGIISDNEAADIMESKHPEQFAFVCINS